MAMNIYGRPMFQGGSIRMAPSIKPLPRYQNGGGVKPMPRDTRNFINTSEAVSAARGGPIRRQVGGGIEAVMPTDLGALVEQPPMPIPAPPPMQAPAPPPMAEELGNVQQTAETFGEQEGAQYAMNMMEGLNAAEESGDPEQAINALRGNEMPISGRYEELATYVGDDDAERTPESVLLMVQPTIMLTEQGAMDSGIGSLMENVVGDIDMETNIGDPTPMGEGVGSLMMAQADTEVGEQPPVNFNYGGPVQRFRTGKEVNSFSPQDFQNVFITDEQELDFADRLNRIENLQGKQDTNFIINALSDFAKSEKAPGSTPAGRFSSSLAKSSGNTAATNALLNEQIDKINKEKFALNRLGIQQGIEVAKKIAEDRAKTNQASEIFKSTKANLQGLDIVEDMAEKGLLSLPKMQQGFRDDYPASSIGFSFTNTVKTLSDLFGTSGGGLGEAVGEAKANEDILASKYLTYVTSESGVGSGDIKIATDGQKKVIPKYFENGVFKIRNKKIEAGKARKLSKQLFTEANIIGTTINNLERKSGRGSDEVYSRNRSRFLAAQQLAVDYAAYADLLEDSPISNRTGDVSSVEDKDWVSDKTRARPESDWDTYRKSVASVASVATPGLDVSEVFSPPSTESSSTQQISVDRTALLEALAASETGSVSGDSYKYLHDANNTVDGPVGKYAIKPSTAVQPGYKAPNVFQLAERNNISISGSKNKETAKNLLLNNKSLQDEFAFRYLNALSANEGSLEKGLKAYSGYTNSNNAEGFKKYKKRGDWEKVFSLVNESNTNAEPYKLVNALEKMGQQDERG